jgi:protein-S-isoprenylcysteine O-methyltransferase Ste14
MTVPKSWSDYRASRLRLGYAPVRPVNAHISRDGTEPEAPDSRPVVIATRIFNILVPLCAILFAWAHAVAFLQTLRLSILIILAKAALEIQFYVRRSTGPFISTSAYAWLVALCGTIGPLMLRPTDDASDFSVATGMQVIGLAMLVGVVRALNRSGGIPVAKHGIRRDGLYRFVRHPIYLAFMFSQYGYVLNHTSLYNVFILALATSFQILRINEEERLLLDDEEYQGYTEQTRWRVIPWVF